MDNTSDHLRQLNNEFALDSLAAMLFLGALMLLGVLGNCLVFYIYLKKMKSSTTRCFIMALAVIDLLTCSICIPIDIFYLRNNYTFGKFATFPCKLSTSFVNFTSFAAGNILIAVAAVRYKKICHPFKQHTSVITAKVAVVLSCMFALVFSFPPLILYGGQTKQTKFANVNVTVCATSDYYVQTVYPLANHGFQFLAFIVVTITLSGLYFRIWRTVARFAESKTWSRKYNNQHSESTFQSETVFGNMSSISAPTSETAKRGCEEAPPRLGNTSSIPASRLGNTSSIPASRLGNTSSISASRLGNTSSISASPQTAGTAKRRCDAMKNPSRREKSARKTAMMLFTITLIFVTSYLPFLSLLIARSVHWEVFEELTGPPLAGYTFFMRTYFINCAVNPFIYSYFNVKVRWEMLSVFRRMRTLIQFKGCK